MGMQSCEITFGYMKRWGILNDGYMKRWGIWNDGVYEMGTGTKLGEPYLWGVGMKSYWGYLGVEYSLYNAYNSC